MIANDRSNAHQALTRAFKAAREACYAIETQSPDDLQIKLAELAENNAYQAVEWLNARDPTSGAHQANGKELITTETRCAICNGDISTDGCIFEFQGTDEYNAPRPPFFCQACLRKTAVNTRAAVIARYYVQETNQRGTQRDSTTGTNECEKQNANASKSHSSHRSTASASSAAPKSHSDTPKP